MWHWIIEAVEAALLGGLAAMSIIQYRRLKRLAQKTASEARVARFLYEKNATRWAEHVKSRMH